MNRILTIILILVVLFACKAKKNVQVLDLSEAMVAEYWANQLDYNHITLKAKANITTASFSQNVNVNIRMKKDSVLWASFGMIGIEGARVLITQDSFKMINRLEKSYTVKSNDYLKRYLGFEVSLLEVQNMLLGNAPFSMDLYQLITLDSSMQLIAKKEGVRNWIAMNSGQRTYFSNFKSDIYQQTAEVYYDNYKSLNGVHLPNEVSIKVLTGSASSSAELTYSDASSEVITAYPFTVPTGYKRIN